MKGDNMSEEAEEKKCDCEGGCDCSKCDCTCCDE